MTIYLSGEKEGQYQQCCEISVHAKKDYVYSSFHWKRNGVKVFTFYIISEVFAAKRWLLVVSIWKFTYIRVTLLLKRATLERDTDC